MNIAGAVFGLMVGAAFGVLIGRYKIYYSLNRTNLLGDDSFGAEDLNRKKMSDTIIGVAVGVIFTIIGVILTVSASNVMKAASNLESSVTVRVNTSETGLMVFGAVLVAFGIIGIWAGIKNYLDMKAQR